MATQSKGPMSIPTLNPATLTFDDVVGAYEVLLKDNPGKALFLGGDLFAAMQSGVVCVTDHPDPGTLAFASDGWGELDRNAWLSSERHWDGDDAPEHTISFIEKPVFYWLDPVQGAAKDLLQHIIDNPDGDIGPR